MLNDLSRVDWFLIHLLAASTCIVLLAMVIDYRLRNSTAQARCRCWQWTSVALLFAVVFAASPFGIEVPWASLKQQSRAMRPSIPDVRQAIQPVNDLSDAFGSGVGSRQSRDDQVTVKARSSIVANAPPSAVSSQRRPAISLAHFLRSALITVWGFGVLFIALRILVACRRASVLSSRIARPGNGRDYVVTALVDSPVLVGVRTPIIALPKEAADWSSQTVDMVLAHERMHIQRRDNAWAIGIHAVCGLLWPSPLVWMVLKKYLAEREVACDEAVIEQGHQPVEYAEVLVRLAFQGTRQPTLAGASIAEPPIRRRVAAILARRAGDATRGGVATLIAPALLMASAFVMGLVRTGPTSVAVAQNPPVNRAAGNTRLEGAPSSGVIELTVTDEFAVPLSRVNVEAFQWNGQFVRVGETAMTDATGKVRMTGLPIESVLQLRIRREGYATGVMTQTFSRPAVRQTTFKLLPPANSWIEILDEHGEPVSGCSLYALQYIDPNGSEGFFNNEVCDSWGIDRCTSDKDGIMTLPPLPLGSRVSVISVIHPKWPAHRLTDCIASDGLVSSLTLQSGVEVSVQLNTPDGDQPVPDGTEVTVRMLPRLGKGGIVHPFKVSEGTVEFSMKPNEYQELMLTSSDFMIGPILTNFPGAPNESLDLTERPGSAETDRSFSLDARRKRTISGTVVDDDNRPLADVAIATMNFSTDDRERIEELLGQNHVTRLTKLMGLTIGHGSSTSDSDGTFSVEVVDGLTALQLSRDGYYSEDPFLLVSVGREKELPRVVLKPLPTIRGVVQRANGELVEGAVVQLKTKAATISPDVGTTGEDGGFSLQLDRMPTADDGTRNAKSAYLVAFDPSSDDAGLVPINFRDLNKDKPPVIVVSPQDGEWLLRPPALADPAGKAHSRTPDQSKFAEQLRERFAAGLPGNRIEPIVAGTWLNTTSRSTEDFRGRFVLLDFWFIGCGPCHRDMPLLKAAHRCFPKDKFAVIGIHDNSQTAENVKHFMDESGIEYATIVDDESGTILKQFADLGVRSFPSYILLDPNGEIYANGRVSSDSQGYSLRANLLEVVRNAVREWRP